MLTSPPFLSCRFPRAALFVLAGFVFTLPFAAKVQAQSPGPQPAYGPYSVHSLAGGLGIRKQLHPHDHLAESQTNWSLSLWLHRAGDSSSTALLAGVGAPLDVFARYIGLRDGRPFFVSGAGHELLAPGALPALGWHSIAVAIGADGISHLYVDGSDVAHDALPIGPAAASLEIVPAITPTAAFHHFGGRLALVSLAENPAAAGLGPDQATALRSPRLDLDSLVFEEASPAAPVQTHAQAGQREPQDPATLPHSRAPFSAPVTRPVPGGSDTLAADGVTLTLEHAWQLAEASTVQGTGDTVSSPDFNAASWYHATMPGTVLTTLIDRGVYPDPDFGLNNLAIPERLARQSFWYRTTVSVPSSMRGRRLTLCFAGINYHATVWMNGKRLGEITGAFIHGSFDVTSVVHPGQQNAIAVLIDPPPHPGIPHEQSIAGGPGENGGIMALDGPTFAATEGWDWIPGIRDRNMGLWQPVTLRGSGDITIENPAIDTTLPLPDTSRADIAIRVPLQNATNASVRGELTVSFDDVSLRVPVAVFPGWDRSHTSPGAVPPAHGPQPSALVAQRLR